MAGLRELQRERRRATILDAVRALLREGAGESLTTERIAARAGVSHQTVYNAIGPRPRVWAALMEDFVAELDRRLLARAHADPVERLRQVLAETVDLFAGDPFVARELLRGWEDSGQALEHGPATHVLDALRDAQAAGLLVEGIDPAQLAAHLNAACLGQIHHWAAGLIDAARLRRRVVAGADVVLAAAARPALRAELLERLRAVPV